MENGIHGCLMEEELFEFLVNMPGLLKDENDYSGKAFDIRVHLCLSFCLFPYSITRYFLRN